jgi:hypothetical protein
MTEDPDWYVSDIHCRRAIQYLYSSLFGEGYLSSQLSHAQLLDLWAEALEQTLAVNEASPIGPDPEAARKFVLTKIEARVTTVEERADQLENALMILSKWLMSNMTHYNWQIHRQIEKTLYEAKKEPDGRAEVTDRAARRADREDD